MIVLKGERENPVYESLLPLQNHLVALEPQHGVEEGPLVLTRVLWIVWGKAGFVFIVVDVVLWIERVVFPWVAAVVKAIPHLDLHDDPAITHSLQKTLETIPVFVVSRGQIVEPSVRATEGLDLIPQIGPVGHGVAKEVATIGDQEVKLLFHLWHLEEIVVITVTKKDLCLSAILPVPGESVQGLIPVFWALIISHVLTTKGDESLAHQLARCRFGTLVVQLTKDGDETLDIVVDLRTVAGEDQTIVMLG